MVSERATAIVNNPINSSPLPDIPSQPTTYQVPTYRGIPLSTGQPTEGAWRKQPAGATPVRSLVLKGEDEEFRKLAATGIGYCVDELCSCERHRCEPPRMLTPFIGDTTYKTAYLPYKQPEGPAQLYGPEGVPIGVDPKTWEDYVAKHGIPPSGQIPPHLFHRAVPDGRDFSTEHRVEYTPKQLPSAAVGLGAFPEGVDPKAWEEYIAKHGLPPPGRIPAHLFYRAAPDNRDFATEHRVEYTPKEATFGAADTYGPDGIPYGVDPKAWRDYVAQYGRPPAGQIPAHLFYRGSPDNRDFTTENRAEYTPKKAEVGIADRYGSDGIPVGVDPAAWKAHIAKQGVPPSGQIPAHLYYRATSDSRDFTTNYRENYVPHVTESCPVTRLPAYPTPNWPREHTFWDPVAKKWY